jgi:ribonucleoside-diphosphate reductase alpha chain
MREIMKYDKKRMYQALLTSGIKKETLDDYIERTSTSELFYKFSKNTPGLLEYDILASDVIKSKYLAPDENGPLLLWDRNARAMASVEKEDKQEYWYNKFMYILKDFKFLPGGRIMHGAGRAEVKREPTLSNCYVIPIEWGYSKDKLEKQSSEIRDIVMNAKKNIKSYEETISLLEKNLLTKKQISEFLFSPDSLEGIYQNLDEAAQVYRTGGGVGTDLSALRPKNSYVNSTMNKAPGITAFMDLLSESTETVAQQGRRGALMLTLRVDHPDIEDFINVKNDKNRSKVKHANISTLLTHEFMKAVEEDSDFILRWQYHDPISNRNGEKIERKIKAKDLWDKIIKSAYDSAEPGLIFWDSMKDYHNVEYANPLSSTNPCGEQPLAKYTACNLGNINLSSFIDKEGNFDYKELAEVTSIATRFMDNVIEYNDSNHALEKIRKSVSSDRRTGLGITGLGDALVKMKIKYDSEKGIGTTEKIMEVIRNNAYKTSIELAKERGVFPLFSWEGYSKSKFIQSLPEEIQNEIKKYGIRNGTVLTVAPVGTGSIVAQTSSGIEPIFATSYRRKVKQNEKKGETKEYKAVHPLIRELFGDDINLPEYVITAHQIDPYFRVKMQGTIQKYVDSSISSTINLPNDITIDTVAKIYLAAYKEGLKGITIYREGSREGVLETEEHSKKENLENKVSNLFLNGEFDNLVRTRISSERPGVIGTTEKIKTHHGNIFVTVNKREDNGSPYEVFAELGKNGAVVKSYSEALGRVISLSLQAGIPSDLIIEQIEGITDEVFFDGSRKTKVHSGPDGIAQIMKEYFLGKKKNNNGIKKENLSEEDKVKKITEPCPTCNEQLIREQSCVKCSSCDYSAC